VIFTTSLASAVGRRKSAVFGHKLRHRVHQGLEQFWYSSGVRSDEVFI
jgi:hypothetical protein